MGGERAGLVIGEVEHHNRVMWLVGYIISAGRFLEDHNGAVTAVATVFIAAFTIVLALVTRRQAHLTRIAAEAAKRSALVAERALTELERPYLAVDVPASGVSVDISGTFSFVEQARWVAINYGRTPALLIDRLTIWPIKAGSAMPYAIDPIAQRGPLFPVGCVSGADKPYEETANLMAEAPIQMMLNQDAWKTHRIFFNGYIRYADLFGGTYPPAQRAPNHERC
jgi:hypothetical protein